MSCNRPTEQADATHVELITAQPSGSQVGEYVVDIIQDTKGELWFGTLQKGVANFDGDNLNYFTTKDGLPSNRITSIIEDKSGNLWFGTGSGISKFDGTNFINYSENDGLCSDRISNLFIDSKGTLWIGTWGGACKFDGTEFQDFQLPYPKIGTIINPDTKDWITSIAEDDTGNIWFGRDGYGVTKFNGESFVHFTTKQGLNANTVQSIAIDNQGDIWIGTRVAEKDKLDTTEQFGQGGLNKYNGNNFVHYPENKGLHNDDVYAIYKSNQNEVWISTLSHGVYRYANNEFIQYDVPTPTMSFAQDQKGNVWLGCAGGLFKIASDGEVVNITTNGPWK